MNEAEYLTQKFIIYLAISHERNNTGIDEMMDANGGYILHNDALENKGGQRRWGAGNPNLTVIVNSQSAM